MTRTRIGLAGVYKLAGLNVCGDFLARASSQRLCWFSLALCEIPRGIYYPAIQFVCLTAAGQEQMSTRPIEALCYCVRLFGKGEESLGGSLLNLRSAADSDLQRLSRLTSSLWAATDCGGDRKAAAWARVGQQALSLAA